MDRKWMFANRLSDEYEDGVDEFVSYAVQHAEAIDNIICPCLKCYHIIRVNQFELKDHLIIHGIDPSYTCWTNHGEMRAESSVRYAACDDDMETDADEGDRVEELANIVEDDFRDCPKMFETLKSDAEKPLYNGCSKFTRLSAVLKLFNLKASNGWTDKSFTELLILLKDMLPEDNVLPSQTYDAKQMMSSIGMGYERIHSCPRDCILFRNEYASLTACPKCHSLRYKKEGSTPEKVLWYFPIIPRFRRMFRSADAKLFTWHATREPDGLLRHPADSPQWKKFDYDNQQFSEETRNLRLALCTDGFNPHSLQSSSHST